MFRARRTRRVGAPDIAGLVALVIAACLGIGWGGALILTMLAITPDLSPEGAALLNTVGGVLAGGVAAYLGNTARIRRNDDEPSDPDDGAPDA
jgi:hypothetical protein